MISRLLITLFILIMCGCTISLKTPEQHKQDRAWCESMGSVSDQVYKDCMRMYGY